MSLNAWLCLCGEQSHNSQLEFYFSLKVTSKSLSELAAEFGKNNKVIITAEPFRLDIYADKDLVISANHRGLLNIEHYRLKQEK